jgi:hypothetical protein
MITAKTLASRRAPIRVSYLREARTYSGLSLALSIVACLVLIFLFFFLSSAQDEAREEYIVKLKAQRQIIEMNKNLKMELTAITHKGYLEFAAKERLGLKRPTDQEVVVLR